MWTGEERVNTNTLHSPHASPLHWGLWQTRAGLFQRVVAHKSTTCAVMFHQQTDLPLPSQLHLEGDTWPRVGDRQATKGWRGDGRGEKLDKVQSQNWACEIDWARAHLQLSSNARSKYWHKTARVNSNLGLSLQQPRMLLSSVSEGELYWTLWKQELHLHIGVHDWQWSL